METIARETAASPLLHRMRLNIGECCHIGQKVATGGKGTGEVAGFFPGLRALSHQGFIAFDTNGDPTLRLRDTTTACPKLHLDQVLGAVGFALRVASALHANACRR